jgi:xylan 1,4-beta-xylosidase
MMTRRDIMRAAAISAALPRPAWALQRPHGVPLQARVRAASIGAPLHHFWSKCVDAGRANEGLRASWLEQLKTVREACGFQYCRFHGLLHDDMFVYRETAGRPVCNWQYIDDLFDRMLVIGVRPFVELGFMPKDLATTARTRFWWKGNVRAWGLPNC